MIDKKMYALEKWERCKIWECHVCPTDSWEDMAKCITCTRRAEYEHMKKHDPWRK